MNAKIKTVEYSIQCKKQPDNRQLSWCLSLSSAASSSVFRTNNGSWTLVPVEENVEENNAAAPAAAKEDLGEDAFQRMEKQQQQQQQQPGDSFSDTTVHPCRKTKVIYHVEIELNAWIPAFLERWLLNSSLPLTMEAFKSRILACKKEFRHQLHLRQIRATEAPQDAAGMHAAPDFLPDKKIHQHSPPPPHQHNNNSHHHHHRHHSHHGGKRGNSALASNV